MPCGTHSPQQGCSDLRAVAVTCQAQQCVTERRHAMPWRGEGKPRGPCAPQAGACQGTGLCSFHISGLFDHTLSCARFNSRKQDFLHSGYSPSQSGLGLAETVNCPVLFQLLELFSGYHAVSLAIINSRSSFTEICSNVPRQYITLWLIFCFILFSLSVDSTAALCWFVLCVCFGSVSIPFHLTFFLCFLHPIFQISLEEHLFCKVRPLAHICESLIVNVWICTCLLWKMHCKDSEPCVACMSAVPNMTQGSYYTPF